MDHVVESTIQALRRKFEILSMKKGEKVSDYASRFVGIITKLRDLGEVLEDREAVSKLLRSVPKEYDALILPPEQFCDLKNMKIAQAIGHLKVHEMQLLERNVREEEQALLSRAFNQAKRGQDECKLPNKRRSSKEEKANVAEEEEESTLMMILSDECGESLLLGVNGATKEDLWYLHTGASIHMCGKKSYFQTMNEDLKGLVRFGDGSSIKYEGKGDVLVNCKNGELMRFVNVLFVPNLKTNILSLGKLDDQGCETNLKNGYLTIHDKKGRQLTKTHKTSGNMYMMKLDVIYKELARGDTLFQVEWKKAQDCPS
ncbi:uncharacterized protein LOC144708301 [Wolffia australiana]